MAHIPGAPQERTQMDPMEFEYSQRLSSELLTNYQTNPFEILNRFNRLQPDVQIDHHHPERPTVIGYEQNNVMFQGRTNDETTVGHGASMKNRLVQSQILTREILSILRRPPTPSDVFYSDLHITQEASQLVLDKLAGIVDGSILYGSFKGSGYLYNVILDSLNNRVTNPLEALSDDDFKKFVLLNPILHDRVAEAMIEAARSLPIPIPNIEIETFLQKRKAESSDISERIYSHNDLFKRYFEGQRTAAHAAVPVSNALLETIDQQEKSLLDYFTMGPSQDVDISAIEDILLAIRTSSGISESKIEEIKGDYNNYRIKIETEGIDGRYESYEELARKINIYDDEFIKSRIFKRGEIDFGAIKDINNLLEDEIGVLFERFINSPQTDFNEGFSPYSEGAMLRKIESRLRVVLNKVAQSIFDAQGISTSTGGPGVVVAIGTDIDGIERRVTFQNSRELYDRLYSSILVPIQRRPEIERLVHQFQSGGAGLGLEDLVKITQKYDITTVAEFYDDELTREMCKLLPEAIQKIQIDGNNLAISDMFQLVSQDTELGNKEYVIKYRKECIDYMEDVLKKMGLGGEEIRKRIESRFSRVFLESFMITQNSEKILSRSKIPRGWFADLPYANIYTVLFNPLHKWGKMSLRGRAPKNLGASETHEFLGMEVFVIDEDAYMTEYAPKYGKVYEHHNPVKMYDKSKKRILYEIFPENTELMEDLESGRKDIFVSTSDVYRGLAPGNMIDQGGWAFDGLEERKFTLANGNSRSLNDQEIDKDLTKAKKLEICYRYTGVSTAFWYVGGMASADTKGMFNHHLAEIMIHDKEKSGATLSQAEKDRIRTQVTAGTLPADVLHKYIGKYTSGDHRFDDIFDVTYGNHQKKVSFREYELKRLCAVRGEVLHQLLQKDPRAWLEELNHDYPELSEGYVTYKKVDGTDYVDPNNNSQMIPASEFYFDLVRHPDSTLSAKDKKKRDEFRYRALTAFRGTSADRLSNAVHLRKIMDFHKDLIDQYRTDPVDATVRRNNTDARLEGRDQLSMILSAANKSAQKRKETAIRPDDTIVQVAGHPPDTRIHDLVYGNRGLITYFNNMVGNPTQYFGNGAENLGAENGFYQRWGFKWEQERRKGLPIGDLNNELIFRDIKSKDALSRYLATNANYGKAQDVFEEMPGVIKKASEAKDFNEFFSVMEEVHHKMSDAITGENEAVEQEYQMHLMNLANTYLAPDSRSEGVIGAFRAIGLDTDLSLATIKSGVTDKFVMTPDGMWSYIQNLRVPSFLKEGFGNFGNASDDTAREIFGATKWDIIRKNASLMLLTFLSIIIVGLMKKAYEETQEK